MRFIVNIKLVEICKSLQNGECPVMSVIITFSFRVEIERVKVRFGQKIKYWPTI